MMGSAAIAGPIFLVLSLVQCVLITSHVKRFLPYFLIFSAALAGTAFYRWATGQVLDAFSLAERGAVLAVTVIIVSVLQSRGARRRKPPSRWWSLLGIPLFGLAAGVSVWQVVSGLLSQRMLVGLNPEAYIGWGQNPWGFALAFSVVIVCAAFFGLLFAVSVVGFSRRCGPSR